MQNCSPDLKGGLIVEKILKNNMRGTDVDAFVCFFLGLSVILKIEAELLTHSDQATRALGDRLYCCGVTAGP